MPDEYQELIDDPEYIAWCDRLDEESYLAQAAEEQFWHDYDEAAKRLAGGLI